MLRFQEIARIDKVFSAQLTVQFVHAGQGTETCSVPQLSSLVLREMICFGVTVADCG